MSATDVARDLARELGLADAEPVTIADRSNLVLRVGPVIARVAMATSMVRVGTAWLEREVKLTRFLAAREVGVTRPLAGPFERGGFVISFWEAEDVLAPPDALAFAAQAGAELRRAHEALAGYREALPLWGGFEEAREVLPRAKAAMTAAERDIVDRAWERAELVVASARGRSASFQAIHGDAHIGNVLWTRRGALWTDWEDAFLGPIEFDLAALRSRAELFGEDRDAIEAMTSAYGVVDRDLVRDLGLVRNVQVVPWLAIFAERLPDVLPRLRARLAKLAPDA
ncbi:MAG: aminoglycoside phosphotransferase family protein [Labilithrix sp.]